MKIIISENTPLEELAYLVIDKVLGAEVAEKYITGNIPQELLSPYAAELINISSNYVKDNTTSLISSRNITTNSYALYFLLINYCKIKFLLKKIPTNFFSKPLNVLDFGAGPGTGSLALLNFLEEDSCITAIEPSREMHSFQKQFFQEYIANDVNLECFLTLTQVESNKTFDLVILGNVLNEMEVNAQRKLLETLTERLSTNGIIVILEPALFNATRNLMELRDRIVTQEKLSILFPCTHNNFCPMLKDSQKDWCHGALSWEAPRIIEMLDRITGFNKHRLKYAILILKRRDHGGSDENEFDYNISQGGELIRIVSFPKKNKRGVQLNGCSKDGYKEYVFSKQDLEKRGVKYKDLEIYDLVKPGTGD